MGLFFFGGFVVRFLIWDHESYLNWERIIYEMRVENKLNAAQKHNVSYEDENEKMKSCRQHINNISKSE